mgnify:CR=1 FL=1
MRGLLLAALLGGAPDLDLPTAVVALEAPTAAERFAAERWLVAHLGAAEVDELLGALEGRDLGEEATWRLGRALGDARGGLGLVLELAAGELASAEPPSLGLEPLLPAEADPSDGGLVQARRLGSLGLDQALAGWHDGLERLPIAGEELELFLREERERSGWRALVHEPRRLADSVDALNRRGDLPVPLVLAPELAERLARERFRSGDALAGGALEGPWDRVLVELAGRAGVGLEAVLRRDGQADELAWLRLVPWGTEGERAGDAQLRLALTDLVRGKPAEGEEAPAPAVQLQLSARFLAGVGWGAGLSWLGERWWNEGDPAALAGLLEAAGRGRFDQRLLTPAGIERLLAEARRLDRQPGDTSRLAQRLEGAFARLPRRLGDPGATSTAGLLLEGWREDGDLGRHLRLVGLAAVGGGDAASADLARAVLAGAAGGETQWACLGILSQARAMDPTRAGAELGAPEALLDLVPDRLAPDELARALARAGVQLDADLAARRPSTLRAGLVALVLADELEDAADLLATGLDLTRPGSWARCLEGGTLGLRVDQLAAGLETLVGAGELLEVRAVLGMAALRAERGPAEDERVDGDLSRAAPEPTALDRLVLLAGAMDPARQGLLAQDLVDHGEGSFLFHDLDALAVLAAAPAGEPARVLLTQRLDEAFTSPRPRDGARVLPAIERCLALLWARSDDGAAERLVQEVTRVAAGHSGSGHPLVTRVLWRRWPPAPPGLPGARIDLDRLAAP